MNKKYVFLPILLFFGLFLASCTSSDNPVTPAATGSVYVTSTPASAQIWVDGTNTNKVTPDTATNLTVGNHTFILKLTDYFNDTVTVNVVAGLQSLPIRTLTIDKSVTTYGPVQIWESDDPSASDPSGIVLKSGLAASIGLSTFGPVDIYYQSTGFVVETAYGLHGNTGRSTSFKIGSSNTLTDGVASPLATNNWDTQVNDIETNYFFLFDSDSHYSKMIITEKHDATVGNPGWVKVKWLYNNKPNDQRF
jgi:hypothetical protein